MQTEYSLQAFEEGSRVYLEGTITKLINEMYDRTHLSSQQFVIVQQYLQWAFAVGFDEGRQQPSKRIPIAQIKDGKVIQIFDSISDAARSLNGDKSWIAKAVRGEVPDAYNFKWKVVKQ